jgi:hypothetical protein
MSQEGKKANLPDISGTSPCASPADLYRTSRDVGVVPFAKVFQAANTSSSAFAIAFLLAFGFAVYDRVPISDWLANHLLPL